MAGKLSIVVPCYNEEATLKTSLPTLLAALDTLVAKNKISLSSGIICVDDGSADQTWEVIEEFSKCDKRINGVKLSRNVGHQNALLAGLSEALDSDCDYALTIDADLQDDVQVIEEMVDKIISSESSIIYGVRSDRKVDPLFKRMTANMFYHIMKNSTSNVIPHHADFRLMDRKSLECLMKFRERNLFLRGIVPLIGFKSDIVTYARNPRLEGNSKYPFIRMMSFAIEGITSFSVTPIRSIFVAGLIFLFITLSVSIYVVISMLLGRNIPGWASLMLSLWFIGSLILMALGIIGEYVSKIYIEIKDRPRYFVEKRTKNEE